VRQSYFTAGPVLLLPTVVNLGPPTLRGIGLGPRPGPGRGLERGFELASMEQPQAQGAGRLLLRPQYALNNVLGMRTPGRGPG